MVLRQKRNTFFPIILGLSLFCGVTASAQVLDNINPFKKSEADKGEISPEVIQIRNDVAALTDAAMQGRKTGTKGEVLAVNFIERRFQHIGLEFFGTSYRRSFKFVSGREVSPETRMFIKEERLLVPEEAVPLPFSAAVESEAFIIPNSLEPNNFWVIPLYGSAAEAQQPSFDWEKEAYEKCQYAIDRGANGIVFYDNFGGKNLPRILMQSRFATLDVPVWFIGKKAYDQYLNGLKSIRGIRVNSAYRAIYGDAVNLMGYINNRAEKTVIVMAHFDGEGFDGAGIPLQNANWNASGTAAMLQVAQQVRKSSFTKYNYLFVAFTGGFLDQLGARKFIEAKNFDSSKIAYVINLDGVGTFNTRYGLELGGVGTAGSWRTVLKKIAPGFKVDLESKGSLTSDHSPFYDKKISYLYFRTGQNADYNSLPDNITRINFKGIYDVSGYVFSIITQMEKEEVPKFRQAFDETPVAAHTEGGVGVDKMPQYKVSLGLIPDAANSNDGVLVSDVTPGKAAAAAGIMKNDVILQIGQYPIQNLDNYMDALTRFERGKKTIVKVKRSGRIQSYNVTFQ